MDRNLSPSHLNQSNVDANDNSLHQFREMTMDGQEATNVLVHTAEASAVSTLKREVVMGLSAYPVKRKSLGRPKTSKVGHEKANKDPQGSDVVIIDDHNEYAKMNMQEISLPTGIEMKYVSDTKLSPEDIGHALQFLEFCRVFGKALDFKKEAAEAILRSLTRKQNMRHVQHTLVIEFQIRLLSLIVSESDIQSAPITASNGESSWLNALNNLITESDRALKDFPLDWLNRGVSGYYELKLTQKLILLNFICDEALGTKALRKYIDDQNAAFTEERKDAKMKVVEAKEKEKNLKQQLEDEMAKVSAELQNETVKTVVSAELRDETAKTVVSTELQDETAKTVVSAELQDETAKTVVAKTVVSAELQDETAKTVVSAELREEMEKIVMSTESLEEIEKIDMSTELQGEKGKAVMTSEASLPNSDHETLLENLRREADKAHTELLDAKGAIPKGKKYCEAIRIEPAYLDNNGKAFWQLESCIEEYSFLLQDVKREYGDSVEVEEKWLGYGLEQKDEVTSSLCWAIEGSLIEAMSAYLIERIVFGI